MTGRHINCCDALVMGRLLTDIPQILPIFNLY